MAAAAKKKKSQKKQRTVAGAPKASSVQKAPRKPKKRAYNNEKRVKKTKAISHLVITTLVELLVEKRGGDVQFAEISKKSKVPMRTIFRLFKDKQALHEAMDAYLLTFIKQSLAQLQKYTFLEFAENTFAAYDEYEAMVIAYLFSPFGHQARDILRKRFNQLLTDQVLKERSHLKVNPKNRSKLALVATLVNAKLWYDLKTDFSLSGKEIGQTIRWALEVLLREIEKEG